MRALFIELPAFERLRNEYLDDEGLRAMQNALMDDPSAGDVIQGTGGLRKLRWTDKRRGKGKRGGLRVIYFYWVRGLEFWLFTLYDENEMNDLSKKDRETLEGLLKKKRNLMAELTEGFVALADQRTGKRTLRTHVVQTKATPKMSAKELSALRERMNLSRALFAKYLRTNVRTLENWEQGRARPNAQAALLIRMVERYPDTVERLAKI